MNIIERIVVGITSVLAIQACSWQSQHIRLTVIGVMTEQGESLDSKK